MTSKSVVKPLASKTANTKRGKPAIQTEIDRMPTPRRKEVVKQTNAAAVLKPIAVVSPEIAQAFGMDKLPADLVQIKEPEGPQRHHKPEGYKVHIKQGGHDGSLSAQWSSRPADQVFDTFPALMDAVRTRKEQSRELVVCTGDITAKGDEGRLSFHIPEGNIVPTHWAWNQLCEAMAIPPSYIKNLPAPLAAQCFQHALDTSTRQNSKLLLSTPADDRAPLVRAFTSETYGRIYDIQFLNVINYLLSQDHRWKIPGVMDWSTGHMRPDVKGDSTLYASQHDVFGFMCQDRDPIEIGKTPNGEPDYYFPGFMFGNSETGAGVAFMKTMFLRGVCMNRNLWGVQGVKEIRLRHKTHALKNFTGEALPSLEQFHVDGTKGFVDVMTRAKQLSIGKTDDEAVEFLNKKGGFSKPDCNRVLELVLKEEQVPARTIYQAVQGVTAMARETKFNDKRLIIEEKAQKILQLAA